MIAVRLPSSRSSSRPASDTVPPIWRSELATAIAEISTGAATGDAWCDALRGLLDRGVVKRGEVDWLGLERWLRSRIAKVSKEELLEWVAEHELLLTEVVLGDDPARSIARDLLDELAQAEYDTSFDELSDRAQQYVLAWARKRNAEGATTTLAPRYAEHILPGSKAYRELLIALPSLSPDQVLSKWQRHFPGWQEGQRYESVMPEADRLRFEADLRRARPRFRSRHWATPDVLVHIRLTARQNVEGERVLLVEEIQSDWAQSGRERGFFNPDDFTVQQERSDRFVITHKSTGARAEPPDGTVAYWNAQAAHDAIDHADIAGRRVLRGPFVTTTEAWVGLAVRRIMVLATQERFDRVAFIDGQHSINRYQLGQQIAALEYELTDSGGYEVVGFNALGEEVLHEGEDEEGVRLARVAELFGKAVANRMQAGAGVALPGGYRQWRRLEGLDLEVGGDGMRAFYDQIVLAVVKKNLRRFNGPGVEPCALLVEDEVHTFQGFRVTQELSQSLHNGAPMFSRAASSGVTAALDLGDGIALADLSALCSQLQARLPASPPIVPLASPMDAPEELRDAIRLRGAAIDAEAVYWNGVIYAFAENLSSLARAEFVLAEHEIAHAGLRAIGGPQLAEALEDLAMLNPALGAQAQARMAADDAIDLATAVEEVLADTPTADLPKLHGWRAVVHALAFGFDRLGLHRAAQVLGGWADRRTPAHAVASVIAGDLLRAARGHASGIATAPQHARFTLARLNHLVATLDTPRAPLASIERSEFASSVQFAYSRLTVPRWRSTLKERLSSLTTRSASPAAWRQIIQGLVGGGGVKREEVVWSGLEEWLEDQAAQGQQSINRADLQQQAEAMGTRVHEVIISDGDMPPLTWVTSWKPADEHGRRHLVADEGYRIAIDSSGTFSVYAEDDTLIHTRVQQLERAKELAAEDHYGAGDPDASVTRYRSYALRGGRNYREVLLILGDRPTPVEVARDIAGSAWDHMSSEQRVAFMDHPTDAQIAARFRTAHWDQSNVLVHLRLADHQDAQGRRVLLVEEVQSDWGQSGAKREHVGPSAGLRRGFKGDPLPYSVRPSEALPGYWEVFHQATGRAEYGMPHSQQHAAQAAAEAANQTAESLRPPSGPFVRNTEGWLTLALKRVVSMAAEHGYDFVACVTGDQATQRFGLNKPVSTIRLATSPSGQISLGVRVADEHTWQDAGRHSTDELLKRLGQQLGHQATSALALVPPGECVELEAPGFQLGGEGLRAFYDEVVPRVLKRLLTLLDPGIEHLQAVQVTGVASYEALVAAGARTGLSQAALDRMPVETRKRLVDEHLPPQMGFAMTPRLRAVAAQGLPLFSRHVSAADSGAFREWFGKSRVVSADGRPLVAYHGTTADFTSFDPAMRGSVTRVSDARKGFFFVGSGKAASEFTWKNGEMTGSVMPVYLSIENPLEVHLPGEWAPGRYDAAIDSAQRNGRDGVIVRGSTTLGWPGDLFIAFRPGQIKSALGNRGTWDSSASDIRFSRSTHPVRGSHWYSELARQIDAATIENAPARTWLEWLRGLPAKGVKQAEIEWSGLQDWLEMQEALGGCSLEGDLAKEGRLLSPAQRRRLAANPGLSSDRISRQQVQHFVSGTTIRVVDVVKRASTETSNLDWDSHSGSDTDGATKYSEYTLPGGENYRELLLTLPEKPFELEATPEQTAYFQFLDSLRADHGLEWRSKAPIADRLTAAHLERKAKESRPRNAWNPDGLVSPQQDRANYRTSHWEEPNVLAHVRLTDRVCTAGGRVLFVEEIQSDWGQSVRAAGSRQLRIEQLTDALLASLGGPIGRRDDTGWHYRWLGQDVVAPEANSYEEARQQQRVRATEEARSRVGTNALPLAPFVRTTDGWLNLSLKRIVKMAVDEGYDKVAFVSGQQSSQRYGLSQQIESIEYRLRVVGGKAGSGLLTAYDSDGKQVLSEPVVRPEELALHIGKDMASRLMKNEGPGYYQSSDRAFVLTGESLAIGGDGMKAFYDSIVPCALKRLLKTVGGGPLEAVQLTGGGSTSREQSQTLRPQPGFTVTPAIRDAARAGMPLFSRRDSAEPVAWVTPSVRRLERALRKAAEQAPDAAHAIPLFHGTRVAFTEFNADRAFSFWGSVRPELATEYAVFRAAADPQPQSPSFGVVLPVTLHASRVFDGDSLPRTVTIGAFFNEMLCQAIALGRTDIDTVAALRGIQSLRSASRREESGPHFAPKDFWHTPHLLFGQDGAETIRELFALMGFDAIRATEDGHLTYGSLDATKLSVDCDQNEVPRRVAGA